MSQRHRVEVHGYCTRDTDIAQFAWGPATKQPAIDMLTQANFYVSDTDTDVYIHGSGFQRTSAVVSPYVIRTSFLKENIIQATIRPPREPETVQLYVQNGPLQSNSTSISFTARP